MWIFLLYVLLKGYLKTSQNSASLFPLPSLSPLNPLPFPSLPFFTFLSFSLTSTLFLFLPRGVWWDFKILVWSRVFQCLTIYIEINPNLYPHTYILSLCPLGGPSKEILQQQQHTLASGYFTKRRKVPWRNGWFSGLGPRKWKMRLGCLVGLQNDGHIPKGLRTPPEKVPTGQILNNFSIKIRNAHMGL